MEKTLFYLLALCLVAFVLNSCKKDDVEPKLTIITKPTVEAPARGGNVKIEFTSTRNWTVLLKQSSTTPSPTSIATWATADVLYGEGGTQTNTINVTVERNSNINQRVLLVQISYGAETPATVSLIQERASPGEEDEITFDNIVIADDVEGLNGADYKYPVANAETQFRVKMGASFTPTVRGILADGSDAHWITATTSNITKIENDKYLVTVTVAKNDTGQERSATIVAGAWNSDRSKFTYNPYLVDGVLFSMTQGEIAASSTHYGSYLLPKEAKDLPITHAGSIAPIYTIKAMDGVASVSWITHNLGAGSAGIEFFTIVANTDVNPRSAMIITGSEKIYVSQMGSDNTVLNVAATTGNRVEKLIQTLNPAGGAAEYMKTITTLNLSGEPTAIDYAFIHGANPVTDSKVVTLDLTYLTNNIPSRASVGEGVFSITKMPNLSAVALPVNATTIGDFAFKEANLQALTSLPATLKSIGIKAFMGAKLNALASLSTALESIGEGAFQNVANGLNLIDKIESTSTNGLTIGIDAFNGADELVLIGGISTSGSLHIKTGAFAPTNSNTTLTLAGNIISQGSIVIGSGAFSANVKGLKIGEIKGTYVELGDIGSNLALFAGGLLSSNLIISGSVVEIKANAFKGLVASSLAAITITSSDGNITIGNNAFIGATVAASCALTITPQTGSGTLSIGREAFSTIANLTTVTLTNISAIGASMAFKGCTTLQSTDGSMIINGTLDNAVITPTSFTAGDTDKIYTVRVTGITPTEFGNATGSASATTLAEKFRWQFSNLTN